MLFSRVTDGSVCDNFPNLESKNVGTQPNTSSVFLTFRDNSANPDISPSVWCRTSLQTGTMAADLV